MIKVLFVCHGNICRSPMAEFLMRHMVEQKGLSHKIVVSSAATSTEEIGNPVHAGTRRKLAQYHISVAGKTAVQLTRQDYLRYDYIIGMDSANIRNILRIVGGDPDGKVSRLLDLSPQPRDIADPWYTGDFDETYEDIQEGCMLLLNKISSSL